MKAPYRLTQRSAPLRRTRLDNLALVPGDLLAHKEAWQRIANRLPKDAVLISLPRGRGVQMETMLAVAKRLAMAGHRVRVLPIEKAMGPDSPSAAQDLRGR